jgi:hypothetical protein
MIDEERRLTRVLPSTVQSRGLLCLSGLHFALCLGTSLMTLNSVYYIDKTTLS